MIRWLLILTGLISPVYIIKYRERIGDLAGEADWMRKIGGVYNIILVIALVIFFWALAEATNTTSILFAPVTHLFPGLVPAPTDDMMIGY